MKLVHTAVACSLGLLPVSALAQVAPDVPPAPETPRGDTPDGPVGEETPDEGVEGTTPSGEEPAEPSEADESTIDAAVEDALSDESLLEETLEVAEEEIRDEGLRFDAVRVRVGRDDVFRAAPSTVRVDETELQELRLDDPNAVLTRAPGVYVRSEDGFGLRPNIGLRGANPDRSSRVTLMEDGVLFGPAPYSAPAAYFFPLMMRMTGVEVTKGPSAILYGPATVAGAVNFLSRPIPRGRDGRVDFGYGSYGTRRAHVFFGQGGAHAGYLLEAVDVGADGFRTIDLAPDVTGYRRGEYLARAYFQTDEDDPRYHRVDVRLGASTEDSHESYLGLSDADFDEDPTRRYVATARDRMRWLRTEARIAYRFERHDRDLALVDGVNRETITDLRITTTAYTHHFDRTWRRLDGFDNGPALFDLLRAPTVGANLAWYRVLTGLDPSDTGLGMRSANTLMLADNHRTYGSHGIQTRILYERRTPRFGHQLEAGLRIHQDSIRRDHGLYGYVVAPATADDPNGGGLVADGFAPETIADETASSVALSGYGTYALDFDRFRVAPGLRFEFIRGVLEDRLDDTRTTSTQAVALPGVAFTYFPMDGLDLFVGLHRGFSPVGAGQAGNVDPEYATALEFGGRFEDDERGLRAELVGFYNDYSNLLLVCQDSSSCPAAIVDQQYNAGSANVGGLELSLRHEVDLGRGVTLPYRVAYTLNVARFRHLASNITTPGYADAVDGDPMPFVPMHQAQVEIGVATEEFSFRSLLSITGPMRENGTSDDADAMLTDPIYMWDASASYLVAPRVRIYVRGENLLNQQPLVSRRPFGARSTKPLTALVGVELDLGE